MTIRKKFFMLGFSVGLLFPIGALIFEYIMKHGNTIIEIHRNTPIMFMIDTAPVFIGIFSLFNGISQEKVEQSKSELQISATNLENTLTTVELHFDEKVKTGNLIDNISKILYSNLNNLNSSIESISLKNQNLITIKNQLKFNGDALHNSSSEITQNTKNIKNNSNTINELSLKINTNFLNMENTFIKILDNLHKEVKQTESLNDFSYDALDIKKILDNISKQIDILSINASIEASRAGESGRGFAVVANEITKLSSQSQDSTQKIENIISNINLMSTDIKKNMNIIIKEINYFVLDMQNLIIESSDIQNYIKHENILLSNISDMTSNQEQKLINLSNLINDIDIQSMEVKNSIIKSEEFLEKNKTNIVTLNNLS